VQGVKSNLQEKAQDQCTKGKQQALVNGLTQPYRLLVAHALGEPLTEQVGQPKDHQQKRRLKPKRNTEKISHRSPFKIQTFIPSDC
jgi:hypothetical protein